MNMKRGNYLPATPVVVTECHRPNDMLCSMLARYRYRLYPDAAQRQSLAKVFGCGRVVFNDALRLREDAHQRGEKISDTEVQRRVITLAKTTPEREWPGEVASVALVQACQDARRAYRNWFGSLAGNGRAARPGIRSSAAGTAASPSGLPATGSLSTARGCTWRRSAT
jgi:hypothetical protein